MPRYQIECYECGNIQDKHLTFSEYDGVKEKPLACEKCGFPTCIGFSPGSLGVILKEGASGGWASKSIKENEYRQRRRKELARRERDHVFKPSLQPNYNGVETGSWKEAQELARKEEGNSVASSYDSFVGKD